MTHYSVVRLLMVFLMASVCSHALAHDSLTAEAVQFYLARVAQLRETLASEPGRAERAQASIRLGQTLDGIAELFNRDIEAHGKVQGLASSVLMSELTTRGTPLVFSVATRRFTANLRYYRDALQWSPSGSVAAEASLELLKKQFYEALGDNPLRPLSQNPAQLAAQVKLGEALRRDFPQHLQREEITFILAIHYMQLARASAQTGGRGRFLAKARALVDEFAAAYPDSLRVTTLTTLLDSAEQPG